MWVIWVLGGLAAWLVVGLLVAMVLGRGIRLADRRAPGTGVDDVLTTADLPGTVRAPLVVPRTRRRVPLPPLGIALAAVVVGLEAVGYATELAGTRGQVARLLSMDAPFSAPRLFVALLFAAAAMAAVAGAGMAPGRRTWWSAVAVVAGLIAAVKAGSTVHATAFDRLSGAVSTPGAIAISVLLAAAVVGWLWVLSGADRRDRRRVLGVLALYAGAAVGLSAVSGLLGGALGGGSRWALMATFIEESGEALSAVAFLMAVLIGVAPRLVLPAEWALRRTDDAYTLDVPGTAQRPAAHHRPHP